MEIENKMEEIKANDFERFSEMGVKSILNQLYQVLENQGEAVEGICFLKNRNALAKNTPLAYIVESIGKSKVIKQAKGKELFYSEFPKWREEVKAGYCIEDFIPANHLSPFKFPNSKNIIVAPIKSDNFFWGVLVCVKNGDSNWSNASKKTTVSFSKLVKNLMIYFHAHKKEVYMVSSLKSQIKSKNHLIDSLQKALKEKNKKIESLTAHKEEAEFKWAGADDNYDEVWLTLHGFKNDNPEPVVSKWEKISKKSVLERIYDNFFASDKLRARA